MKQTLVALVVGLILVIGFFWGNITVPAVNYTPAVGTNDFVDLNIPFRFFLGESLKRREFPLWASGTSGGYPILAEGQIGALYPPNIALARLPVLWSPLLTILTMYLLLFLFSWLYLRQIRLGMGASLFGALLVSFSGFAANELMHWGIFISFAWFVGQIWMLEKYLADRRVSRIFWMGLFLGLSILGGHPQIVFYSLFFLVLYWGVFWFFGVQPQPRNRRLVTLLGSVFLFGILGMGIGAGQILPQLEFTRNSTRAAGLSELAIEQFSFPISHLTTFVRPFAKVNPEHTFAAFTENGWPADERYVYMGVLGLLLAVVGMVSSGRWGLRVAFFAVATWVALVLSFGGQFTTGFILKLPPFSFFRLPFRMLFMVNFSLAVLAAMTLERLWGWIAKRQLPRWLSLGALGIVFLVSFWDLRWHAKQLYPEVKAHDWFREPEVVAFLRERLQNQERVTGQQYFYPTLKIFLEKPELWDNPQIFINLRNLLPVFNNLLYDIPENIGAANSGGLKIARYNELENEVYFRGLRYGEKGHISLTDSFMFLTRLMGVRFFLVTQPVAHYNLVEVKKIPFETGQDPVYVYELFDYYPRVFMVPRAQRAEPQEILQHLVAGDFDPLRVVYVEEDIEFRASGGYAAAATFERYSDQEVVVTTQASGDGFLFLSDTFYPGWKAFVDGVETKILTANYAFRAVPVPEGEHRVVFRYSPSSFWWGLRVTIGTAAVTLAGILVLAMRERGLRQEN